MTDFKWLGLKVNCYNSLLQEGAYDFFTSFSYKGEKFAIGEFALFEQPSNPKLLKIGRLLSVFYSHKGKTKYKGTVCWYIWAKDVMNLKTNGLPVEFDEGNEVVEDTSATDVIVSLEDIQKKCKVIFASLDDPQYLIKANNLNADIYFSCRYKMKDKQLEPLFSVESIKNVLQQNYVVSHELSQLNELEFSNIDEINGTPIKTTPSKLLKHKRKSALINLDSEGSDVEEENLSKIRSPSNPLKNLKLTPKSNDKKLNGAFASSIKRNASVKRVLNDSFGSSTTSPSGIPIYSYSIVSPKHEDVKHIKVKLKLVDDRTALNLKVFPPKLDNDIVHTKSPIKINDLELVDNRITLSPTKAKNPRCLVKDELAKTPARIGMERRRSSRTVERKSYVEFLPEQSTPKKRIRRGSTDSNRSIKIKTPFKEIIDKMLIKIDEDDDSNDNEKSKRDLDKTDVIEIIDSDNEYSLRPKRNAGRPRKYYSGDANEIINSPKTTSRPKRSLGPRKNYNEFDEDDEKGIKNKYMPLISSKKHANSANETINSPRTTPRPQRSVGRPKKYITSDESNDDDGKLEFSDNHDSDNKFITPRHKRNVGRPTKYNDAELSNSKGNTDRSNRSVKSKNYKNKCESEDSSSDGQTDEDKSPVKININGSKRKIVPPERYNTTDDLSSKTPSRTSKQNLRKSILKSSSKKQTYADSDEDDIQVRTPKTPKQVRAISTPKSVKDTPTARARMIREGIITPSVQAREKAVLKDNTPLSKARTQLHVSFVPKALPCREKEFADIISFLEGKLLDGCGGCMYISGVPGTGKTATVTDVIRSLQQSAEDKDVPSFKYVNVNGMRLSEPRQSYVEIVKQLMGKTVPWEQAQTMLENRFVKSQKKSEAIILVVDELDILCTKRQDVVYNLLDWPTKANAQLVVITIANTMDLPERLLMGRVTSRLGLTRLTFQAYTHKQLQEIVTKRLTGTSAFNPDAIQLVARKVASVSGDARRALDICRRSVEIAELEGKHTLVSMTHVNQALNAMITQPKVQAIKRCCRLEKLILQSIVSEVERTGVEETNFASIYRMLISIAALEGFQMVSSTIAMAAVTKLGACRLLLTDQKCNNLYQRIILNVSVDDVYYALNQVDL